MSGKNSILGLYEPKGRISWYFYTFEHLKFHAELSRAWKKFYNLRAWLEKPDCLNLTLYYMTNNTWLLHLQIVHVWNMHDLQV